MILLFQVECQQGSSIC